MRRFREKPQPGVLMIDWVRPSPTLLHSKT